MSSNSVHINAQLFEHAHLQGRLMSRSTAQQLEHWARLGAAIAALGLSVADMAHILQSQQAQDQAFTEVVPDSKLWAFKRARQAQDLDNIRAGRATNEQMSWFSGGKARAAKLAHSRPGRALLRGHGIEVLRALDLKALRRGSAGHEEQLLRVEAAFKKRASAAAR